jgi:hypothetical protein
MDWQRNFVFDCLAGRAGLEAPISVADTEPGLPPAMMTHLLLSTKRQTEAFAAPQHPRFDHFRIRLIYPQ